MKEIEKMMTKDRSDMQYITSDNSPRAKVYQMPLQAEDQELTIVSGDFPWGPKGPQGQQLPLISES